MTDSRRVRVSYPFQLRRSKLPVLGLVVVDDADESLRGPFDILDGARVTFLDLAPLQRGVLDAALRLDFAAHCEVEEALPCSWSFHITPVGARRVWFLVLLICPWPC